jgi:vacuolar-type H+-ATPase subunit I/STV1
MCQRSEAASPIDFSFVSLSGFLIFLTIFIGVLYLGFKIKKKPFTCKKIIHVFIAVIIIDLFIVGLCLINNIIIQKIKFAQLFYGSPYSEIIFFLQIFYILLPIIFIIVGPILFTYFYIKGVPNWRIFPKKIIG